MAKIRAMGVIDMNALTKEPDIEVWEATLNGQYYGTMHIMADRNRPISKSREMAYDRLCQIKPKTPALKNIELRYITTVK